MCQKRCFTSRKAAKTFLRRLEGIGAVDRRMHVYRCPHPGCAGWHFGHMPTAVKCGVLARAEAR